MKRLILNVLFAVIAVTCGYANDGVYFTSGNFLVPVAETDIAVSKEILTITVGRDSFARVDVYYEFLNRDREKTVTMAFEAASPYNAMEQLRRDGGHPYIHDFTVTMNGQPLEYTNGLVAVRWSDDVCDTDFTPLDASKWKGAGEVADSILPFDNALYNPELDSITSFAYAYYFPALFRHGKNIVHHTYRYRMSYNVACEFEVPYWLTPATRWANRQVDDFTLRIKSDGPVDICLADSLFGSAPFVITEGHGDLHSLDTKYMGHFLLASLGRCSTLEWHARNFSPKASMSIASADFLLPDLRWTTSCTVVVLPDGRACRYVGDSGDKYLVLAQDYMEVPKEGARIMEYSAEKGQGLVYAKRNSKVNVRQQPSEKSRRVGTMESADGDLPRQYPCLGLANGWYRVRIGDKTGYVREDLLDWTP